MRKTVLDRWGPAAAIGLGRLHATLYTYLRLQLEICPPLSLETLCKFAYDTNQIRPASNEASRRGHIELVSLQKWAKRNNLKLNCDKCCEVVL